MRRKLIGALTALVVGSTTASATAVPDGGTAVPVGGDADRTSVTLLTGDTVRLLTVGGRRSATVEPAEGREQTAIHQLEIDGELHVLPADVLPYVADGLVDMELFSIDALIEQGYDDDSVDAVPLIATYAPGARTYDAGVLEAADPAEQLESIDAQALTVDKDTADRFWQSLTAGGTGASGHDTPRLSAGVEKLWLDGKVQADLHESVAQIGAPVAWETGNDGTGVTVAVLDTGADAEHPDLVGRITAQRSFTGQESTYDGHGHGTHVAATVAGTGAGSDGLRKGVAPGADLIVGKVLDDAGGGTESDIIAGMEWAAESGADVVNMSLGGEATDGTDPMSRAVDELSHTYDTLFVIAAGNSGPDDRTIGSPAAADSSLAVGAVDRDDNLADFSSRGPRLGDLAVKPDITAPGVDIVAARSGGTAMGSVVDDLYTAASGTSMAAPHVAGAAALLAAQHPGWSWSQLKDALISTSLPGDLTAYEQGGGRVDVARATSQAITATGALGLGSFTEGETGTVRREVSWTNGGDTDVELDLDLSLSDARGVSVGGAVVLGADTVTVPAGETVGVPVVVDVAGLPLGQFTGSLTASADGVVAHTTLSLIKDPPRHEVTIRAVGRDGAGAAATPFVLFGEDPRFDVVLLGTGGGKLEVAEGSYFLYAGIDSEDEEESSVIVDPDIHVDGDMELTLDARKATRVEIETPQPAEPRGNIGFTVYRKVGDRTFTGSTMKFDLTSDVYVTPTDRAERGYFEFTSRWQLSAPKLKAQEPGRHGLTLWPDYERHSPEADLRGAQKVVDVGRGRPEDYTGRRDVRRAIVVAHVADKGLLDDAVAAAADAGAAMLLIAPDDERGWWTDFSGRPPLLPLPVAILSGEEAEQVSARLSGQGGPGGLRLEISGSQQVPYRYDVVQVSPHRVPERVVHTVSERNTATVTARYHETGGEQWSAEQRFAWRPWQTSSIVETHHEVRTPQSRVEYVSSGASDTLWRQHVVDYVPWESSSALTGGMTHDLRTYRPGEKVVHEWNRAVLRPAVVGDGATRTGDELTIDVAELVQGTGATYERAGDGTTGRILENGVVVADGTGVPGTYMASGRWGRYQIELSTLKGESEGAFSTATDTVWTFDSTRPRSRTVQQLPMMRVDYDVPVDLDNHVRARGRSHPVRLTVDHPGAVRVATLEAWASFDGGRSWERLHVDRARTGDVFEAQVQHKGKTGAVSLKVRATAADGSSITQSVISAYALD